MSDIVAKIAALLRIAEREPDTPQGHTAAALAQKLMAKHGVTVSLDEDVPADTDGPATARAGVYPIRYGWIHSVAVTVSMLCNVEIEWMSTIEGFAECFVTDPNGDAESADFAASMILQIVRIVNSIGLPQAHTRLDDEMAAAFRRGIADAIGERLRPVQDPASGWRNVDDARIERVRKQLQLTGSVDPIEQTPGLVLVRSFLAERAPITLTPFPEAQGFDEANIIRTSGFHRQLYMAGRRQGRFVPLPNMAFNLRRGASW